MKRSKFRQIFYDFYKSKSSWVVKYYFKILGKKAKKDIDILVLGNGIEFANLVALNLKIKIQVFKNFGIVSNFLKLYIFHK